MKLFKTIHHKLLKYCVNTSCIILIIFLLLEILSRIFLNGYYSFKNTCSIEDYASYENLKQCRHSQETIPIIEYAPFVESILSKNHIGKGWKTNTQHLRYNIDIPEKKKNNEIRIFITGGSTAWGLGVNQEQTFAYVLENLLNTYDPTKLYRVMIAASTVWTSSQEVMFINNYITELKPDLIIMFTGWNDIYAGYNGRDFNKLTDFLDFRYAISATSHNPNVYGYIEGDIIPEFIEPSYYTFSSKLLYLIKKTIHKFYTRTNSFKKKFKKNQLTWSKVILNVKDNIDLTNFLSKKYNFNFFYCLQPSLYNTNKILSKAEIELLKRYQNHYINYYEYSTNLYPKLKSYLENYSKTTNFIFLNADKAITTEKKAVFSDISHFGTRGNNLIAQFLFEAIKENFIKKDMLQNKNNKTH